MLNTPVKLALFATAGVFLAGLMRSRPAVAEGPDEMPLPEVRPAGPESMEAPPEDWDAIDEASDASFPASDPPPSSTATAAPPPKDPEMMN